MEALLEAAHQRECNVSSISWGAWEHASHISDRREHKWPITPLKISTYWYEATVSIGCSQIITTSCMDVKTGTFLEKTSPFWVTLIRGVSNDLGKLGLPSSPICIHSNILLGLLHLGSDMNCDPIALLPSSGSFLFSLKNISPNKFLVHNPL